LHGPCPAAELHGDIEVHAEASGAERVTFSFEATTGVNHIFTAVLDSRC
jgi:hypothetical protein